MIFMTKRNRNWGEQVENCARAIRTYFIYHGNPRAVDEAKLKRYLKKEGHEKPIIEIALSGIYFN